MSKLSDELALPAYTGLSDEDAAHLLNDPVIPSNSTITCDRLRWYLMSKPLWLQIKRSSGDSAELMMDMLREFSQFDINAPREKALLRGVLDGLIADAAVPGFTQPNKTQIMAMGDDLISWAQDNNLRKVQIWQVKEARS